MSTNEPPPYPGDLPDPSGSDHSSGDSYGTGGMPTWGSVPPPEGAPPVPPPSGPAGPGATQVPPEQPYDATAAIAWGWQTFRRNVGATLTATLVMLVAFVVASVVPNLLVGVDIFGGADPFGADPFRTDQTVADVVPSLIAQLVSTVLTFVVTGAFARATLDVADGGRFDFFGAFGRIPLGDVALVAIIVGALSVVAELVRLQGGLLLIPVYLLSLLVLSLLTFFAPWAVVDGAPPVEAVRRSAGLAVRNIGNLLLLMILGGLVLVAGFLALCVGFLVAWPVVMLASGYTYRRFEARPVTT